MAHTPENRDLWIAGGVLAAFVLILFLVHHKPVVVENQLPTTTSDTSGNGPPSYNIPPMLQLPPFNTGNQVPSGSAANDHNGCDCGCGGSVCNNGGCGSGSGSGSNYLSQFLTALGKANVTSGSGDSTIAPFTLPPVPTITAPVKNIVGPPPANSYAVWRAKEGLDPPGPANNNTHQRDSIPPGLTNQQQYKLYSLLNGGLFGNASIDGQNTIMAQIYDMPSGPEGTQSPSANQNVSTGYSNGSSGVGYVGLSNPNYVPGG